MAFLRASAAAALATAVCAGALAVAASPTAAAPSIRFGLKDDAWLLHGPGTLDDRVAQLQELGVQVVRFALDWSQIAPTRPAAPDDPDDPAYRWGDADGVLQALHEQGIETLLDLVATPAWANGGRPPQYAPRSSASIAGFATAAARRYPWVRRWAIWNEPNQRRWLVPAAPAIYVTKLLNPAYAALHRGLPHVQVGGGITAPRGGKGGMSPIAWIRGMARAGAHLDAYGHNPYPLDPRHETPTAGGCDHCLTLTMATLPRLLAEVRRAFGDARVWLTEYGYQTNPPDRVLGVSRVRQAEYESEASLRAYLAPRVDLLIHFLFRDEPTLGRFQSGLVDGRNRRKPAYAAFQLALAQRSRTGGRVVLWGQERLPDGGPVHLQIRRGAGWRTLGSVRRTSPRGYFGWTGMLPTGTRVRAVAGDVAGAPLGIR
jgi:hypothetical protein